MRMQSGLPKCSQVYSVYESFDDFKEDISVSSFLKFISHVPNRVSAIG